MPDDSPKHKNVWFKPPKSRQAAPKTKSNHKEFCVSPRSWKKVGGVAEGLAAVSDLEKFPHPTVPEARHGKVAHVVLLDPYLTLSAKVVFCILAGEYFGRGEPVVQITKKRLEEFSGISRVTLLDALRLLIARRHVEDLGKNRYRLLPAYYSEDFWRSR